MFKICPTLSARFIFPSVKFLCKKMSVLIRKLEIENNIDDVYEFLHWFKWQFGLYCTLFFPSKCIEDLWTRFGSTEWGTVWFRCVADIRWAQSPFHGGRHTMPPSICLHDSEYRNDSTMLFNNSLDIWGLFAHQHHCTLSRAVVTFSNTLNVNASNHTFKDLDNDINEFL